MKLNVHVHDNNHVPAGQNCLGENLLEEGKTLTLHYHEGECQRCANGHCHDAVLSLLLVKSPADELELFVVIEGGLPVPDQITFEATKPHGTVRHK